MPLPGERPHLLGRQAVEISTLHGFFTGFFHGFSTGYFHG